MPGLHLLFSSSSIFREEEDLFRKTLDKMKHYDDYDVSFLLKKEGFLIGCSGYHHYPVRYLHYDEVDVVIEGNIHLTDSRLKTIFSSMPFDDESNLKEKVSRFIMEADGEFLVTVYHRNKNIALFFNDAFGRLPVYIYSSHELTIISREIKFIIPFLNEIVFDKEGIAEYLIFQFPLKNKTLIKDISRLLGGTFLFFDVEKKIKNIREIVSWNLDSEKSECNDMEKMAENLVPTFLKPIREMTQFLRDKTVLIGLSGGYDSRTVLAGLSKVKIKPIAITFINNQYGKELPQAQQIANICGVTHKVISVPDQEECERSEMQWLVYLEDGLNSANQYPALKFTKIIRGLFEGELIIFTGEGGDKTLAPLGYNFRISSEKQLVQYVYLKDRLFNIKEVSQLLDIDENKIINNVESVFASYPEKTLEGKFKHFKIFERAVKWLFVGEDRDRFVCWNTTPFYSLSFFKEVMKISETIKKDRCFYKIFLSKINDKCAEVKYLLPMVVPFLSKLTTRMPVPIFSFLAKYFTKYSFIGSKIKNQKLPFLLIEIVDRSTMVQKYFNVKNLKKIIEKETSQEKLFILLTILSYMDIIEGNVRKLKNRSK